MEGCEEGIKKSQEESDGEHVHQTLGVRTEASQVETEMMEEGRKG